MSKRDEAIRQAAEYLSCETADLAGDTLRSAFTECESMGATVWWGCWTDAELDAAI